MSTKEGSEGVCRELRDTTNMHAGQEHRVPLLERIKRSSTEAVALVEEVQRIQNEFILICHIAPLNVRHENRIMMTPQLVGWAA